jgi:hypothetical protein
MPTCYNVCGEEHGSKAALQREWRKRTKKYTGPGRMPASKEDSAWFVAAAFASVTHRGLLFQENSVYIDKAAKKQTCRSKQHKGTPTRHMASVRCVFFASMADPTKSHSVASNLGDTPGQQSKLATLGWLRNAIQGQIDTYRRKRKMQASLAEAKCYRPYNCEICKRTCRGKENHIDHGTGEQSFKAILKNFQTDCLLRPVTAKDGDTPSIRSKWEKYHKQMARLSLTCKACNLANK